ncbi:MAG: glycosyltransferase family 61 protein [Cyanobacteria bacterium P01_B01_bin.77]
MNNANHKLIQSSDSSVTLLQVEAGYTNDKGEVYNQDGVFIDFPRELGSKQRKDLNPASVDKQFKNKVVGCFVQERRNYSYYHWTYETLPKLIYLSNNRKELKVDKLYFHFGRFGHPYQRQALRHLGFSYWQVLDAKRIKSLKAQEIVAIKLNETRLEPSLQLCQTIKSAFLKKPIESPYRKIYLTRDHVKTGRKLLNEHELREILERHGFQTVIADNLNVISQAKLFNESQYIVSPHGAALANIAFCESGTRILELFNQVDPSTWSSIYSTIAQACGFDLVPIGPQPGQTESDHRSNFYTDLDAIEAALEKWEL